MLNDTCGCNPVMKSSPTMDNTNEILNDISGIISDISNQSTAIRDKIVGAAPTACTGAPCDTSCLIGYLKAIRAVLGDVYNTLTEANRGL